MFELGALHAHVDGLRLGGFKLRFRLRHFHFGRQPAVVAVGGQIQSFLIGDHGGVQQLLLRIQPAQREVVGRQFGVNAQPGGFQIRRAGLGVGRGGFNGAVDPPPGIHLIGKVEGQDEIALRLARFGGRDWEHSWKVVPR